MSSDVETETPEDTMASPEMGANPDMGAGDWVGEERRSNEKGALYKRSIFALPVRVQVVIGTAKPSISNLLQMKESSVLPLTSKIDDPVELVVDNRVIARGELIEIEESGEIGVRLTEIVDMAEDTMQ